MVAVTAAPPEGLVMGEAINVALGAATITAGRPG